MDEDWGGLDIEGLKDAHRADMAEIWADEARAEHAAAIRQRAVENVAKAHFAALSGLVDEEERLLWEALDDD